MGALLRGGPVASLWALTCIAAVTTGAQAFDWPLQLVKAPKLLKSVVPRLRAEHASKARSTGYARVVAVLPESK